MRPHRIVRFVSPSFHSITLRGFCVFLFCVALPPAARAQQMQKTMPAMPGNTAISADAASTRFEQDQTSDLARKANVARMASLKNDTEKLFKLA